MAQLAKAPGLEYIPLPKVLATGYNTLLRKVITNAKALNPLPKSMATRVAQLDLASAGLSEALGLKHGEDKSADPARVEADEAVDKAIKAYHAFLAYAAGVDDASSKIAEEARLAFFKKDDSLAFLNLEFDQEWSEIETRIAHSESVGAFEAVEEIGGGKAVANLKKKHKAYGKALGVTAATTKKVAATLEEPYARAQDALRRFVAAAIAHGAESDVDPSVIETAERLLAPIEELREKVALQRRADGGKGEEPVTPSGPADGSKDGDDQGKPKPDGTD